MLEQPIILLDSNTEISDYHEIPKELIDAIVKFLISSPSILILTICMYFSGHLWVYIILSYISKKERKFLNNWISKTALGLMWFSLVFVLINLITYRNFNFNVILLLRSLITVTIIALAVQAIIFLIVNWLHRKG